MPNGDLLRKACRKSRCAIRVAPANGEYGNNPLECQFDLSRGSLFGLLDEGRDDHDPLVFGRHVERAGNAGFPLQTDLPELAADVADVRLFDVGRPTDSINSEIRTKRARMSAGNSASSASTVSFNVSTVHAIAGN